MLSLAPIVETAVKSTKVFDPETCIDDPTAVPFTVTVTELAAAGRTNDKC